MKFITLRLLMVNSIYKSGKYFILTGSCLLLLLIISVIPSYASGSHPPYISPVPAPQVTPCPNTYEGVIQRIDSDNVIRCYGASGGLGFMTTGLQAICGPVLCPVEPSHDKLARGQSCVREDSAGICHPGVGASGYFDKGADSGLCQEDKSVVVPCPPTYPLYIKAVDQNGNSVYTAKLKISYEDAPPTDINGRSTTVLTSGADSNGVLKVPGIFHSGDHFTITPLTENNASDSAHMVGSSMKFFDQEINSELSCGGSENNPCYVLVYQPYTKGNDNIFLVIVLILVALFLLYILR